MNFCGIDSADSENYQPAACAIDLGSCNNSIKTSHAFYTPWKGYTGYDWCLVDCEC